MIPSKGDAFAPFWLRMQPVAVLGARNPVRRNGDNVQVI
jgi:hypothetical protein